MKILFVLFLAVVIAGCAVPVKRTFPDIPDSLKGACAELNEAPVDTAKLSDLLQVINENYSSYYKCRVLNNGWAEWYRTQKKNFEEVK